MSKRNYSITRKKGQWYHAKVIDSYGSVFDNYFKYAHEANDWIYYIWENEKPPLTHEEEMDLLAQSATAVREVKAILDGMNS